MKVQYYSEKQALRASSELAKAVESTLGDYLERRSAGEKEVVIDFMFEYYRFRPLKLAKWSPGLSYNVEESAATKELLAELPMISQESMLKLDVRTLAPKRQIALKWQIELQESIQQKNGIYNCFGLHEWAMLYKSDQARHPYLPLRVSQKEIDLVVDHAQLKCTHFDAYRFFTMPSKPLNEHELSREELIQHEQPACLHNNMDLYKWATKFYPWISSDLIWKCFGFALEARTLDMEASPYDLTEFGYKAVPIEDSEGRAEYVSRQRLLAKKAVNLRTQLISELRFIEHSIN